MYSLCSMQPDKEHVAFSCGGFNQEPARPSRAPMCSQIPMTQRYAEAPVASLDPHLDVLQRVFQRRAAVRQGLQDVAQRKLAAAPCCHDVVCASPLDACQQLCVANQEVGQRLGIPVP